MLIRDLREKEIKKLSEIMSQKLTEHRLFKFLCPKEEERRDFIEAYFRYYIPRWLTRGDYLLIDENYDVFLVLAGARRSLHKFSGKGAKKLKKFSSAHTIFFYRGNLAYLAQLLAPRNKRLKVMTIFSDGTHDDVALELVDEAVALSDKYGFNLMYDSLTRRLVNNMLEKNFIIMYQKMFASTGYVQTLMILNNND